MSFNFPLICHSCRVLPFLLNFSGMVWRGGGKLEINIPPQQIYAKCKGGLIIEWHVMSSEYGTCLHEVLPTKFRKPFCHQTLLSVSHIIRAVSSNVYITVLEQGQVLVI